LIKSQRFWSKELRNKVDLANQAIKTRNLTELESIVNELIILLKDSNVIWKDRVAICFILEQIAAIEPLLPKIIDTLKLVLQTEQDPHVKEFTVWALGKIVEDHHTLILVKDTLPIIVQFLNDDSDQVKKLATEYHTRLQEFIKVHENASQQIEILRRDFMKTVEEKLTEMKTRSDIISSDALKLNYKTAFDQQHEMKTRIKQFNEANQVIEDELILQKEKLVKEIPEFLGAADEILRYWRTQRGDKEDLVRRIECIIRIQSKIFMIIKFILSQNIGEKINLEELKDLTSLTGRPYSEKEIIEILQQLVQEEIIPNFMLDQIKEYQIKGEEKQSKSENGTNSKQ
jgi:hypothetical protein